jgi:hypothetical protein
MVQREIYFGIETHQVSWAAIVFLQLTGDILELKILEPLIFQAVLATGADSWRIVIEMNKN